MELDPPEPTLIMLETDAAAVIGKDWYTRLDKVFTSNLGKYRKYKGGSVRDLLRAMRNKVSCLSHLDSSSEPHADESETPLPRSRTCRQASSRLPPYWFLELFHFEISSFVFARTCGC